MSRRIVILRSNPVAPDSRVEKEASALVENGFEVTIVAWDRRSNHQPSNELINVFGYDISIVRFGHVANYGDGLKSLWPFVRFQWNIFRWLFKNRKKADVIHACDFDTAFTASIVNLILRKKFVFDIFDYIGGERESFRQKLLCRLQSWIINRSDATILCTEERREQIKPAKPRKIVVVHNAPPCVESEVDVTNFSKDGIIKVCYVGILQDYRLLKEMPEFFINHPEFELHIGGFGKYEEFYDSLSKTYDNIKYYGKLLYSDTLRLEQNCDIMLAIYDPTVENHVYAAPNKFYESLMLGKPVVMVRNTGMASIVDKYHIGVTIDYSIAGFERGLLALKARRDEWPSISQKMKLVYNGFSWDKMKGRLCALYDDI